MKKIVVAIIALGISACGSESEKVLYKNCQEARDAGATPLKLGEPGYRLELDRNEDGIACE